MTRTSANRWGVGATIALGVLAASPAAHTQGFFKPLFEPFSNPAIMPARPEPSQSSSSRAMPFAGEGDIFGRPAMQPQPRASVSVDAGGGSQAYCVRTCHGRYFPISTGGSQSNAASCNSFCPASETKLVYGSTIDHAATRSG